METIALAIFVGMIGYCIGEERGRRKQIQIGPWGNTVSKPPESPVSGR